MIDFLEKKKIVSKRCIFLCFIELIDCIELQLVKNYWKLKIRENYTFIMIV